MRWNERKRSKKISRIDRYTVIDEAEELGDKGEKR